MKKLIKITAILSYLILMAALLLITVTAMDFYVIPEFPDNQRQNGSSFFDLIVTPGMQQDLILMVGNTGDEDIQVFVELITATTGRSGQINYTSRGTPDTTLKFSFEDIASIQQTHYNIPVGGGTIIPVSLTIPDDTFEGAILGSIRILREATDQERENSDAFVNQFAYTTAVRLVMRDNAEEIIQPDFMLGSIALEIYNEKMSVAVQIRNTEPVIVKDATVTARLYHRNSDLLLLENSIDPVDFAPNSIFSFSFAGIDDFNFDTGDYTVHINVLHEGKTRDFEKSFTITRDENDESIIILSPIQDEVEKEGIPVWIFIITGIGALLLAALIVYAKVIVKRK